ncbi:MAG: thiolase family protein [Dehalococcoidia bacterium]
MSDALKKAAIVGVYESAQARSLRRTPIDLYLEVVQGALQDAGLTVKDVDGVVGGNPLLTEGEGRGMPGSVFAEYFGTQLRYSGQALTATQADALGILHAMEAVAMGRAHTVLVAMASATPGFGVPGGDSGQGVSGDQWISPFGLARVGYYGMFARRHMYEYGTTSAQLARVAVNARRHALLNPSAIMHDRGPITVDDVLGSRMIYDPLHLLDCSPVNEGGGAIVVTTEERARSLKHRPIHVLGFAEAYSAVDIFDLPTITAFDGDGGRSGREAFAMAGVTQADIDLAQISDHFSINPIIELEDLGFCKKGEGGPFVESGAVELGGKMPINTNGGYLSHSHAGGPGIFDIIELVQQLRGEAGARQVPNARIGLYHGVGATYISAQTAILARD